MPPTAKPSADVMLLIGQLLEATKAAGEGLKTTNTEIQANGRALIAAVKTLELIEETVSELDRLVRTGNGDSLMTRVTMLKSDIEALQEQVKELKADKATLTSEVDALKRDKDSVVTGKGVLKTLGQLLGWIIATAIAVYAALKGQG